MTGDFYGEPQDIERGLTLCSGTAAAFGCAGELRPELGVAESRDLHGLSCPASGCEADRPSEPAVVHSSTGSLRFKEDDVPPAIPADSFFQLEVTTIPISMFQEPKVTGNRLLDLFGQLDASVLKVNHSKFSIKVKVCSEGVFCNIKVRVYRQEHGHAVEFQRRSGDGIVFNRIFRRALERLSP